MLGIPVTIFFICFPTFFLKLIYHTYDGFHYVRILAPVCLFQYVQAPLSSCLDAMGKSRDSMIGTTLGMIVRTSLLFILSFFKIGLYGLIIAISINVLVVTFYEISRVKKYLK